MRWADGDGGGDGDVEQVGTNMNDQKDVVDGGRDGMILLLIYGQGFPIQTSHVLTIDNTHVPQVFSLGVEEY